MWNGKGAIFTLGAVLISIIITKGKKNIGKKSLERVLLIDSMQHIQISVYYV